MATEPASAKPVYVWATKKCPNAHTEMCIGDKCAFFDYTEGMCSQLSAVIVARREMAMKSMKAR